MSVGIPSIDPANALSRISAEALFQAIESGRSPVIVDVRTSEEFRGSSGRIASALSLPLHQLVARRTELLPYRHETLALVSYLGLRARVAAFGLSLAGFDAVVWLEGGLERWIRLGYPTEIGHRPFASSG
jgi:rhodanese-related sulfurtransferase